MKQYRPERFEKKWRDQWKKAKLYSPTKDAVPGKKNMMVLTEFPYPSGNLHIGHWFAFSLPDMYARFKRMQGYNVLYPIGFDAFGLPAENAAIKRKLNPRTWTQKNIAYMTKQLETMGAVFDWSRAVSTIDPDYYRWTQWMFLRMYEKGLAYRAMTSVNWCPTDKTVLANEQVVDGKCERCGATVEQKRKEQWMFRTTAYANELVDGLSDVEWPDVTTTAQRNWIGRSEGAKFRFQLAVPGQGEKHAVEVFTTRPDTLYGVTFLVVSPELAQKWVDMGWTPAAPVREYITAALNVRALDRMSDAKTKAGVDAGITATHPATRERIPVWIAEYVLGSYGTGAVMAVPAHDERDFAFAVEHNLPVKAVVMPSLTDSSNPPLPGKKDTFRNMILAIVWDPKTDRYLTLDWSKEGWTTFITGGVEDGEDRVAAAQREIQEETGYTNVRLIRSLGLTEARFYAAHKDVNRLTHGEHFLFELISNTQVPVSSSESEQHAVVWRSANEIESRKMQHAEFALVWERVKGGTGVYSGEGVLIASGKHSGMHSSEAGPQIVAAYGGSREQSFRLRDWTLSRQRYWGVPIPMINCATCGYQPVRDKDLPVKLPTLSSFLPTDSGDSPLARANAWKKTTCPKCKKPAVRETDTMDTFVDSSWYYLRYVDPKNKKMFADKAKLKKWLPVTLYIGGAEHNTMHLLYSRFFAQALYDLKYIPFREPFARRVNHGTVLGPDGLKMSKSKGNVIDPDAEVKKYGADTVRLYLAFMSPFEQGGPWNANGILGVYRFLARAYACGQRLLKIAEPKKGATIALDRDAEHLLHSSIQKMTEQLHELSLNTAVSTLMILLNGIEDLEKRDARAAQVLFKTFIVLLAPLAPHLSEELWSMSGQVRSVHIAKWPAFDPAKAIRDTVTIAVQVMGKLRATIEVSRDQEDAIVEAAALAHQDVQKWLEGRQIVRIIHVKNRLVNVVLDS